MTRKLMTSTPLSAPPLEQMQPLKRYKRKAPLPPNASHFILIPPADFRDIVEDVPMQTDPGIVWKSFRPTNWITCIFTILLLFMPLATGVKLDLTQINVGHGEILEMRSTRVSRDVLEVRLGDSVTVTCKSYNKYKRKLEWGSLPNLNICLPAAR